MVIVVIVIFLFPSPPREPHGHFPRTREESPPTHAFSVLGILSLSLSLSLSLPLFLSVGLLLLVLLLGGAHPVALRQSAVAGRAGE